MKKKFLNTKKCVKVEKVSELRGITVSVFLRFFVPGEAARNC
jgi:hypothetical protein